MARRFRICRNNRYRPNPAPILPTRWGLPPRVNQPPPDIDISAIVRGRFPETGKLTPDPDRPGPGKDRKGESMSFAFSEGNPPEDTSRLHKPPFDTERLDRLMEDARLDALLVTSKHSIQYLLGGYRFFFYDYMDAHGLSRYLPFFVYVKGRP